MKQSGNSIPRYEQLPLRQILAQATAARMVSQEESQEDGDLHKPRWQRIFAAPSPKRERSDSRVRL